MTPHTFRRILATLALILAAGAAGALDQVVAQRAVVPSPDRPHGEVRLVERDGDVVVQTLLHSKVLRRVAGKIADKERVNWPAGGSGADDSARYIDALAEVASALRAGSPTGEDRRRALCIEFAVVGERGRVTISGARVEADADGLRLVGTIEPTVEIETSSHYAHRNRLLIVADAFGVNDMSAARMLDDPGELGAPP